MKVGVVFEKMVQLLRCLDNKHFGVEEEYDQRFYAKAS